LSKIFQLKQWLSISEAAKHLSNRWNEEVTSADVLRLALDGHLKMSVNFVNHARGLLAKVVGYDEVEWDDMPPELRLHIPNIPDEAKGKPIKVMRSLNIGDGRYLNVADTLTTINGIWDLPMIGAERLDVEHRFQMLTGGAAVSLMNLEGPFVENESGVMCQLHESMDDGKLANTSKDLLTAIRDSLVDGSIDDAFAVRILNEHQSERQRHLEHKAARPDVSHYPAAGLPTDAVLVVRTSVLREFEESLEKPSSKVDRPLATNERNTLLTLIAALCANTGIQSTDRGAAALLTQMTDGIGAPVSDETIRKVLRQIPDALATRSK
jgi:hypothetical protein